MNPTAFPSRQRGVTLIVALILLAIMSLMAVTTLRATVMQERMSANTFDRDLAFQAAEAGLRMGERQAEKWARESIDASTTACPSAKTDSGLYVNVNPAANCKPWEGSTSLWHEAKNDKYDADEGTLAFATSGLSLSPAYIVELISVHASCNPATPGAGDSQCKRFRVTATSDASGGRARVILQSIYATE